MSQMKEKNTEEILEKLILRLLEKYSMHKGNITDPIFNSYFKEKFGMAFEQKIRSEAQIIKSIDESIKVAEILNQYQDVLTKLEKEQPIYSMQKLLSFVDNDNCASLLKENYKELKQQQKLIEDELKKFGILTSWLERHKLCEKGKNVTKYSECDDAPQRSSESIMNFLKRTMGGISDYDHAIQIYINGTATNDLLLYNRLKIFRTYLISKGIVPASFNVNKLYDDIRMVKK